MYSFISECLSSVPFLLWKYSKHLGATLSLTSWTKCLWLPKIGNFFWDKVSHPICTFRILGLQMWSNMPNLCSAEDKMPGFMNVKQALYPMNYLNHRIGQWPLGWKRVISVSCASLFSLSLFFHSDFSLLLTMDLEGGRAYSVLQSRGHSSS